MSPEFQLGHHFYSFISAPNSACLNHRLTVSARNAHLSEMGGDDATLFLIIKEY